jgi:hypothetical protein
MGDGMNLALFHPSKAEAKPPILPFYVQNVSVESFSNGGESFAPPPKS